MKRLRNGIGNLGFIKYRWLAPLVCWTGAVCFWVYAESLQADLAKTQRDLGTVTAAADHYESSVEQPANASNATHAFLKAQGAEKAISDVLADLTRLAAAAGVTLPSGRYDHVVSNDGQVRTVTFTLPTKTTYPQLKALLGKLANSVPSVQLDRIAIERPSLGGNLIEAELTLSAVAVRQP